ncbi:helix-turn-helix transcriptional regulator [Paenibacillus aurantius]|uniref:Helix-turn-helix transcriptional regulator n=1 Tax=Paenibacillus aurantius TaxID=2918900 RepID=A0AA96LFZ9_9BACL|nr:helix-turn-helix transcriptional regulator [Paenibacillus aurantius]WNQ11390.1 helix-turn-helix transcriptional regulator [Paenibacillus aurantius]
MNTEMLKGTIDLLLLSVLNKKENYGYEISRTIKERTKGVFEIQEATLYLSLKRLEKQGAVTSYWGSESHGGRRKYYSVTDEGRKLLDQYTQEWKQTVDIVDPFL